jgi:hypothetical protein
MRSLRSNTRLRVLLPTAVLALLGMGAYAFAFSGTPGGDEPLPPLPVHKPSTKPATDVTLGAWAKEASAICAAADEENAKLDTPQSPAEMLVLLPASLDNADEAVAQLRELAVPPAQKARIEKMLKHYARFVEIEREAVTALQGGDVPGYASLTGEAFAASDKGDEIASALGADACAEDGRGDTPLARELERHRVVVAVLYAPGAQLDSLAVHEARAGADLSGAGFVAIDVYDTQQIAAVSSEYSTRGSPSVLIYVRNRGAVVIFEGWVDSETVAQAVDNASV